MSINHQIDCFSVQFKFWKFIGIGPEYSKNTFYNFYSLVFISIVYVLYIFLATLNFWFVPKLLDVLVEEIIFYLNEVAVFSKVLTFIIMKPKILKLLDTLESNTFQPRTVKSKKLIENAKTFNIQFWRLNALISYLSHLTHISSPVLNHIFQGTELTLPLCAYAFLSDCFIKTHIYPLYFYQCFGIHCHMVSNLNVDTFFVGLMVLAIAQLEILDDKLRNVTDIKFNQSEEPSEDIADQQNKESEHINQLNKCILHFYDIDCFCRNIQEVFSIIIFVQFSAASIVICVCLFRFTLPATSEYYVFLLTYITIMIFQIMVPCWFGIRVMDKSRDLSIAVYNCDWTPRSRRFKSSLCLMAVRFSRPITIIGWKMYPLSLVTFTSIMNSAYSFFTLLRHMQSLQTEA